MIALWREMPVRGRMLTGLLLVLLLAAPLLADRYLLSVLILIFYFAYLGQAWNLMMGLAGQLSLGHALHVGLGAYVAAMLWVYFGVGPWLGVFAAMAIAGLMGAAIAWLGCRFSIEGVYFALLTIAFAEVARIAFDHIGAAGGAGGFFVPYQAQRLGEWWNLRGGQALFYYVGLLLAIGAMILTAWLKGSRLGYQWRAVREDQQAARALGIDILAAKMKAATISAAMTAVGGVFYVFYYNNLFPAQVFGIGRSIELILAPIVGGLGTIFGPVVGAFILTPLGELLTAALEKLGVNAPGAKALFYGLILMLIIFVRPDGVWPWLARACGLGARSRETSS
ncbi:MAG TPA: branched-chain amino acid ABC transporter permease [Xanthobacteraceae bacterium]|jgi:branched-chain amino acid transport system permease protein